MPNNSCKKMPDIYKCETCDFTSSNKYNYNKHIMTPKHLRRQNTTSNLANNDKYICECGKSYIHRTSLYNHKKKCGYIENTNKIILSKEISNDLILKLVQDNTNVKSMLFKQFETLQEQQKLVQNENKELRNQINELIPKIGNNNTVNTTINKQKFNINIFLNEQCKDALTINEFIDKIKITLDDLLLTKNKGICEGVSNIFIENMNKLSVYERPMHCTDAKRETVYIKSDVDSENGIYGGLSQWEKDEKNKKLKQAIKKVSCAQQKKLDVWIKEHPNWMEKSDEQDEYMSLIKNCTDEFKEEKVIKKLCNNIYLNGEDTNSS